jgi:DNA-binding CsgD family transcriptional regulator
MAIRARSRFVGRQQEFATARRLLDQVRAGDGPGLLLVGGAAGIGKTRLLAELGAYSQHGGATVLIGSCIPLGHHIPYAPVVEILQAVPAGAELLPAFGAEPDGVPRVDPPGRQRLFHAVVRLVADLADREPVLVGVEDLHWADQSTLALLAFLTQQLKNRPVLVVGTHRDDELEPGHPNRRMLAELARLDHATTISLRGLDREQTAQQLTGLLGELASPAMVQAVFDRSQGNPFLTEVLAPLEGTGPLPVAVSDLILRGAYDLAPGSREVLRTAALAGPRIGHHLLTAVHGEGPALADALRDAIAHHLLVAETDGYRFRHVLIAEALTADLLPHERRSLHASLATALSDHPEWGTSASIAAQVAHHWYAAGRLPEALAAAVRAGIAASAVHAHQEALDSLERAVSLWPSVPDADRLAGIDRVALHSIAAELADLLGDGARAIELAALAAEAVDADAEPRRASRMFALLSQYCLCEYRDDEAQAALDRAAALLENEPACAERAEVSATRAWTALRREMPEPAAAYGAEAIELGQAMSDPNAETMGRLGLGFGLLYEGRLDAGVDQTRAALPLVTSTPLSDSYFQVCLYLVGALRMARRFDEALTVAIDAHVASRTAGLEQAYGTRMLDEAARVELLRGNPAAATRLTEQARACDPTVYVVRLLDLTDAERALVDGDLKACGELLDQIDMTATLRSRRPSKIGRLLAVRVQVAVRERRFADARAELAAGWPALVGTVGERWYGSVLAYGLWVEAELAIAARASRDGSAVSEVERRVADYNAAAELLADDVEQQAWRATCVAESARALGKPAVEGWRLGLDRWRALGDRFQTAYAGWRLAESLLAESWPANTQVRAHHRDTAAQLLREAFHDAENVAAGWLAGEIESAARLHRVRLADPAPVADRPGGVPDLTAREVEVLQHIAVGRSNREIAHALFISPKTASVHVSNILRKLNADRRADAAQAARQLGILDF